MTTTDPEKLIAFAEASGAKLYPWQADLLRLLAVAPPGSVLSFGRRAGVSTMRQVIEDYKKQEATTQAAPDERKLV